MLRTSPIHSRFYIFCICLVLSCFLYLVHTSVQADQACPSPNQVKGILTTNTIWSKQCSPYIMTGNVQVSQGITLTIEPGTNIAYAGTFFIQVDGALKAVGTEQEPIIFQAGGRGVKFTDTSVDFSTSTGQGSVLAYAKFADISGDGIAAITISNASPLITHNKILAGVNNVAISGGGTNSVVSFNEITNNGHTTFSLSGNPTIENNYIHDNSGRTSVSGGIFHDNVLVNNQYSDPCSIEAVYMGRNTTVEHNLFYNSSGSLLTGEACSWDSNVISITLRNNTFTYSNRGIIIGGNIKQPILNNNFIGAPTSIDDVYVNGHTGPPVTVTVQNNFWNSVDAAVIESRIWDYRDDFTAPVIVDYANFALAPFENTPPTPPDSVVHFDDSVSPDFDDDGNLEFRWNAAWDDVGVDHYNVYVAMDNGAFVFSKTTVTNIVAITGQMGHVYQIKVEAADAAGKVSWPAQSALVTVTQGIATLTPTNTATATPIPTPISVLKETISAGFNDTCGVKADSTLACWGRNDYGQANPPAGFFTQVNAGNQLHACGVKLDGTVICWGSNPRGQTDAPTDAFIQVSAGGSHTCGVKTDGTLVCWGYNGDGETNAPTGIFAQVSAGLFHTCGLRANGTITCWGDNTSGQANAPTGTFIQVSVGYSLSCGVKITGAVICWGLNDLGQANPPNDSFTQISVSLYAVCGVRTNGTLACWGYNGDGETNAPAGVFTQVSVGYTHACAVKTDGAVLCWGDNSSGQTSVPPGFGIIATPTSTSTPTNIPTATATNTPTTTPTTTPTPTETATATSTFLPTPTASNTPTNTPIETATSTAVNPPTSTQTSTSTDMPTNIPPNTPISTTTPTSTATSTPAPTATSTPLAPTPTSTLTVTPTQTPSSAQKALVLIYAALDNNLQADWARLVNNIEQGVTPNTHVRLFIDGPDDDDAYIYDVKSDEQADCPNLDNITCDGRYKLDVALHRASENSAAPATLTQFITDSLSLYPDATQFVLALVGHGSGWSAGVLPGEAQEFIDQPRPWSEQPRPWSEQPGALLWDDHPAPGKNRTYSLSIKGLDNALYFAQQVTGRPFDLLYLDGCSLGMVEVAYEVHNHAHYMLASPNTSWSNFTYNRLLVAVNPDQRNARQLGEAWLRSNATVLRTAGFYPFTFALVDLSQLEKLAQATSSLSNVLGSMLPNHKDEIEAAFLTTDHYESDYNGVLNKLDAYSDLDSFALALTKEFSGVLNVEQAVQSVRATISSTVVYKDYQPGKPPNSNNHWDWKNYGGVGVYLPLVQDEERRKFYTNTEIMWAYATSWDEFLDEYYQQTFVAKRASLSDLKPLLTCVTTTDSNCTELAKPLSLGYQLYLPLVLR